MTLTYPADFAYKPHVKNAIKKSIAHHTDGNYPELWAPSHSMGKVFGLQHQHAQSMDSTGYPVVRISKGWRAVGRKNCSAKEPLKLDNTKLIEKKQSFWRVYCNNSTIHGLKYLADETVHWIERYIWLAMITLAAIGIVYVSYKVQARFLDNRLSTVVESTVYPIYEVPYPAVTICNFNRVNWHRVPAAIKYFLPNHTQDAEDKLIEVLVGMNSFEFGSFDVFEPLTNLSVAELDHINLTDLYRQVNHRCDELLEPTCWWRNKFVDCCSIFAEQKSEYGICYAFNSQTNPVGQQRAANESNYPWRTSNFGDWSGLRFNVRISDSTRMPGLKTPAGILVNVHHPLQWPNSAQFVPVGTQTSVVIKPTYSYVAASVGSLDVDTRECVFAFETTEHGLQTLPGLQYLRPNCISECRQQTMVSSCNCSLDFIFPTGEYPQCNASALKCLYRFDAIFNYEIPPKGNKYFEDDEIGMMCNCMPECELIDYGVEVSPIPNPAYRNGSVEEKLSDRITLDVHFRLATMVRYRTGLVYDWMDLLVAFGGIAGLFLGCSLLSLAEIILYILLGLLQTFKERSKLFKK